MKKLFFSIMAIVLISTFSFAQTSRKRKTKSSTRYEATQTSNVETIEKKGDSNDKIKAFSAETRLKIDEIVKPIDEKKKIVSNNTKFSKDEKTKLENEYDAIKEKMLIELLGDAGYKNYLNSKIN